MIGNFPELVNFNQLIPNLHQSICNYTEHDI